MNDKLKKILISKDFTIKDAMRFMSMNGQKEVFIIDECDKLFGVLSDGDIRKWILNDGDLEGSVTQACNCSPKVLIQEADQETAKKMMIEYGIESVPVLTCDNKIEEVFLWNEVFSGKKPQKRPTVNTSVVIMAGGKGTRLDPFTKILPKPLIPIGEKPIIEIIMDKFLEHGVSVFYLSIFHKARMIRSYFEETDGKYNIEFVEEKKSLGTIGGLGLLKKKLKQDIIVTNCDVIIDTDYAELLEFHQDKKNDLTLVASMRHFKIPYGVCELGSGGTLKKIKEKPEYDLLVNTGMYVISPRVVDIIPKDRSYTIIDLINDMKNKGLSVGVFPISEKSWIDVGQWEEYHKSIKLLGI